MNTSPSTATISRVATLNPLQQGLKQSLNAAPSVAPCNVATLNPLQQGLKREAGGDGIPFFIGLQR